jgi:hypothetical protein
MIKVKATREGLVGGKTSSGWVIDEEFPFVALPSVKAIGHWVRIYNPLNGKMCCAQVRDVGPFNTDDDKYVFGGERPLSEHGISISGKGTNHAGIDLGEAVWNLLGMKDNTDVYWEMIPVTILHVS